MSVDMEQEQETNTFDWAGRVRVLEQQCRDLSARVEQLVGDLMEARAEKQEVETRFEQFKERVVRVGGRAAEEHDMCSVYDDVMEEIGLPRRPRPFTVVGRVHYTQAFEVMARSHEEAEAMVGDAEIVSYWQPRTPLEGVTAEGYASDIEVEVSESEAF